MLALGMAFVASEGLVDRRIVLPGAGDRLPFCCPPTPPADDGVAVVLVEQSVNVRSASPSVRTYGARRDRSLVRRQIG